MISEVGPFTVETLNENPFIDIKYRVWVTGKPEVSHIFNSSRELGNYFEQVCQDYLSGKPNA
jgi:hypothetical protein